MLMLQYIYYAFIKVSVICCLIICQLIIGQYIKMYSIICLGWIINPPPILSLVSLRKICGRR